MTPRVTLQEYSLTIKREILTWQGDAFCCARWKIVHVTLKIQCYSLEKY
jgi:hypothetical protein